MLGLVVLGFISKLSLPLKMGQSHIRVLPPLPAFLLLLPPPVPPFRRHFTLLPSDGDRLFRAVPVMRLPARLPARSPPPPPPPPPSP